MPRARNRAKSKDTDRAAVAAGKPWLEWAASAVGIVIVIGILAILGRDAFTGGASAPVVRVEAGDVTAHAGGFTLQVRARNPSGATAAQVEIEGVLRDGERVVESARLLLDFVPAGSSRSGGLYFASDPRRFDVRLRALGYADP